VRKICDPWRSKASDFISSAQDFNDGGTAARALSLGRLSEQSACCGHEVNAGETDISTPKLD